MRTKFARKKTIERKNRKRLFIAERPQKNIVGSASEIFQRRETVDVGQRTVRHRVSVYAYCFYILGRERKFSRRIRGNDDRPFHYAVRDFPGRRRVSVRGFVRSVRKRKTAAGFGRE